MSYGYMSGYLDIGEEKYSLYRHSLQQAGIKCYAQKKYSNLLNSYSYYASPMQMNGPEYPLVY